jgi:uncharacterized membrane protein
MSAISSPGAAGAPSPSVPHAESSERRLPPVTQVAILTLSLIVAGGVYLAAKIPHHVSLAPAVGLLAAAAALLLANAVMLSRITPFAWRRFFQVGRWTLLAYAIITGMLEYVFIYDGVRGGTLAVLTGMLAVFTLNVPLVISFTVARYADPGE